MSRKQENAVRPAGEGAPVGRGPGAGRPGPDVPDGRRQVRPWPHAWRAGLAWLLGAILFVVVFSTSPAGRQPGGAYPIEVDALLALDLLLGQVAVLAVLFRRRWPMPVAALTMALFAVSAFAAPAAFLAVVSLATRRRIVPLLLIAGITVIAACVYDFVVTPWLDPEGAIDSPPLWTLLAIALVIFGVCALVGWNVGSRRALVASWRLQADTAHREQTARVAQARLAERARIAREMHDVLAHRLSVVAMHAGGLTYRDDLPRVEVAVTAETIRFNAHTALEELRELLGVLRAEDIDGAGAGGGQGDAVGAGADARQAPQPGLSDIPTLVAEVETQGERVRLEAASPLWSHSVSLPASTGRHAYRVVQEALTNARKHAPGEVARVLLDGGPDTGLTVRVSNPVSRRSSPTPGSQLGLTGMSERVGLAGGRLEAGQRGDQFVIDIWLPWQRETEGGRGTGPEGRGRRR